MDVTLTEAERRNGWDEAKLRAYLDDRERRAMQIISARMDRKPEGPSIINCKAFDVHAWARS